MNSRMMAAAFVALLIVAGSAAVLLFGTGDDQETDEGSVGDNRVDTLTVGTTMDISDITLYDYGYSRTAALLTLEALVSIGMDGGYEPSLAKEWETEDSKEWTFHLRENVTWHDGEEFTAEDVVFSYEYQMEKGDQFAVVQGELDTIEEIDSHTVRMILKEPNYNFLSAVVVADIIPKHVFQHVEDPSTYSQENATLGTGPFQFEGFDADAGTCTFSVYEDYYLGKANIDQIVFRVYGNPETMITVLRNGEVDTVYDYARGIEHSQVPKLMEKEDISLMTNQSLGITNCLWFNNNETHFQNATLREAMSLAIDYQELKQLFTAGYGEIPSTGWVPEGTRYYKETPELARNLTEANRLLDELGYVDIDDDDMRETPEGDEFRPEVALRADRSEHVRVGQVLEEYFEEIGVDVKVAPYDQATYFEMLDFTKGYDMAIYGTTFWGMIMHQHYGTGYVDADFFGWSNVGDPEFQSMVSDLRNASDPEDREQLAHDLQDWYAENLPQVTLYSIPIIQPYNDRYEGYASNPYRGIICQETFFSLHQAE
ncbi:MAG: ABC transporter substrate-binding protein [Methanomassiliicoccales archaeon]